MPLLIIGGKIMFYISQLNQSDCGFASLKMLLANVLKNEDYLHLKQDEEHGPYNYFELIEIASDYGVCLVGVKAQDKEEFDSWDRYPFLTTIKVGDNFHAITVAKKRGKRIYVLDPVKGPHWLKIIDFIKIWDGTLLYVDQIEEGKKKPINSLKKFDKLKRYKYALQTVQLFVSFAFLTFLLFLGLDFSPYVSVSAFFVYAILEVVFRELIIKLTTDYDKLVLEEVKALPKDNYLFINRLNECKKNLLTSKISIISNVLLTCTLIFMMIFNGLLNIIPVCVVIGACLLETFVFSPYLIKKERVIAEKELNIAKSKDVEEFKSSFLLVNSMSSEYAKAAFLFKILKIVMIVLSVGIVLYISKEMSITNLLFYTMISLYLEKGINDLFQIASNRKQNDLAKVKLNNLIDSN